MKRRFISLGLALVVLGTGAAYASGRDRAASGSTSEVAADGSSIAQPTTSVAAGPDELKAALVAQGFSGEIVERVTTIVGKFSAAYVKGVQTNSSMVQGRSVEDMIESKLVPRLGYTNAQITHHPETNTNEIVPAQPIWDRMSPEIQNMVRMTAIQQVESLLNNEGGR